MKYVLDIEPKYVKVNNFGCPQLLLEKYYVKYLYFLYQNKPTTERKFVKIFCANLFHAGRFE